MVTVGDVGVETFDECKRRMRTQMRRLRIGQDADARARADAAIRERLCALRALEEAEVVLSYLSFGSEVDTRGIIERAWAAGKAVALPRCVPGTRMMQWYRVHSFDGLERNRLGMDEPRPDPACEQLTDTGERMLALVPGLAFDTSGYRLGYGGGFYDTFLAGFNGVSVGLCRELLLRESLQNEGVVESHDLPVQLVVTERRVFCFE